jgi:polyisoprenoid-binding protein YceI
MKLASLVLSCVLCAATAAEAQPARYELDVEHIALGFFVHHLGYAKVLGVFEQVEGSFVFDEATGAVSEVVVHVNTASVDTHHERRDEHLRSDDFLDSRNYPGMRFTASRAQRTGERSFAIDGELELLGQTHPLTLNATWNKSEAYPMGARQYVIGVSAKGTLLRSDYGMNYGVDNGWVGDEVEFVIEFEARRQ